MKFINKKIILVVIILMVGIILLGISKPKDNIILESVNLKSDKDNSMFAIMLEQDDGTYKEDISNTWPTSGYTYNESMSGCIDGNGNEIENSLSYNTDTKNVSIRTKEASYCYLYFSKPATAFAVYSDDDYSLTFYKNKDTVTKGQQYKGKTATWIYTGFEDTVYYIIPWKSRSEEIQSVKVADQISPISTAYWFYNFSNSALTMDLAKLDTSKVTDMSGMFESSSVTNVNMNLWDVSNVTDMSQMFYQASIADVDLSSWNVSNVTDITEMFYQTSITNLNLNSWNLGNIENMDAMFLGSSIVNLNLNSWNVSNVNSMSGMFGGTLINILDLSSWNVSNVSNMSYMFESSLIENLNVSNWDTSGVKRMEAMFYGCTNLTLDCSNWDVSNIENYYGFNYDAPGVVIPSSFNSEDAGMDY